jgi:hypothetical protein
VQHSGIHDKAETVPVALAAHAGAKLDFLEFI